MLFAYHLAPLNGDERRFHLLPRGDFIFLHRADFRLWKSYRRQITEDLSLWRNKEKDMLSCLYPIFLINGILQIGIDRILIIFSAYWLPYLFGTRKVTCFCNILWRDTIDWEKFHNIFDQARILDSKHKGGQFCTMCSKSIGLFVHIHTKFSIWLA